MKEGFATIGKELKKELNEVTVELSWHREELTDIIGFEDNVRGFDLEFMTDDSIDFLDLYSQFLGYNYYIDIFQLSGILQDEGKLLESTEHNE